MEKRKEAERERIKHSNSILDSYIEKAKEREMKHSQESSKIVQNIHDESMRRRSEEAYRSHEMTVAINKSLMNSYNTEKNALDDFMNRHQKLSDKGKEAIKREQNRTYFN